MRALYAERQAVIVDEARRELRGLLEVRAAAAGMHLVGWLPEGVDDRAASRAARARGVQTQPLSSFAVEPTRRGGLVLGYAAYNERELRQAVALLAEALHALRRDARRKVS